MAIEQYFNFNKSIYENNFELFKTNFNIIKEDPDFFVNLDRYSKQAILQSIKTNNKKIYHYFFKNIKDNEILNTSEILNNIVINHDTELLTFFLNKNLFLKKNYQFAFNSAANLGFNDILYLLTNHFNNEIITNNYSILYNLVLSGNLKSVDLFLKGLNFDNIIKTPNCLLGEMLMSLEEAATISILGKQYDIFCYIVDLLILIENKYKNEANYILYNLYGKSLNKKNLKFLNYLINNYSSYNFKKYNSFEFIELAMELEFFDFSYKFVEDLKGWDYLKTNHIDTYNKLLNIEKFKNF